ncbi:MAG TPA: ABC transporter substrate-binding protein [Methylomirabilota bacterium]|jgi:NitT/TauT family transport system substrate-binding protein|nr:ABC transporter substrate-binding protein [Methylomirabilota bacterium]
MVTSRRQFFRVTAGGLAAATSVAGPRRPAAAQTGTVKIGTAVLGDYSLTAPTLIALDKGYFKAQGVTAEFQPFRGGPDLVKAVLANQIQIGITGSTDVPVFRAEGVPVRFVATTVDGNHFTFNVAPGIAKLAELKGKSIGVTRVGATTWIFAVMLARQQGWDPERDVKIVGLGGLDAQLAALARGEIHAYVWGDGGAVTELQGKSRVLLRLDTVTPKWISQSCYCTDDYVKQNREALGRALKALFQGVRFIRESPKEAFAIVAKTLQWSEEAVSRAHQISGPLLSNDGTINVEAVEVMQTTLLEFKAQKQRVPTQDLYTTEFTPVRL